MCVGASFQEFRRLSTGEFVRAVAKDLGEILLCDHRIVLVLFGRNLRQFLPPGFRDVLGFSTVGLARLQAVGPVRKYAGRSDFHLAVAKGKPAAI